jgi:hypothetical protein
LESKLPISGFLPFLKGSRLAKGTKSL